jgi:protein required for attachment to host cells
MPTWILVANASCANLYVTDNVRANSLTLVKEFTHPDSRKKGVDLVCDKAGRYKGDSKIGSAYEDKTSPKKVESEHFALELAKDLNHNFSLNKYRNIAIIAPAHFYAFIKQHLDPRIPVLIHAAKDYTKYGIKDLGLALRELSFPDK